ncbi:MAG: DUF4364 family protein [Oscillospiraceae bacterium]|nr:DUF4364 family protein [Oscillospiraceae bacterium]
MNKMLYSSEIEDELMIQFIIMYALNNSDEEVAYADLLSIVQENCEISFTDLQLGLDNLINTGHVSIRNINDILSVYDITDKGKYVIDFFYRQIPLIIREPIDKSIKEMYIEKRRREAVKASIEPMNKREYYSLCELRNDDKMLVMSIKLYAGERTEAERVAEFFKANPTEIYDAVLKAFNEKELTADEKTV